MNWLTTCAVVIPCYNEEATITRLVSEVRQHLPIVLVVDDGSSDQTAQGAAEAGAQVIQLKPNRGKGAAIKVGVDAAIEQKRAWIMIMDGDGQHRPEDTPAFLQCADETGAALIVGNRMHNAKAMPWLRRQVNRWMSQRISERAGMYLPDSQCGFRLVSAKAWANMHFATNHFEIESEMLLAFIRARYRIEFVPIRVVAKTRPSHIQPLRDTVRWLKWYRGTRPE